MRGGAEVEPGGLEAAGAVGFHRLHELAHGGGAGRELGRLQRPGGHQGEAFAEHGAEARHLRELASPPFGGGDEHGLLRRIGRDAPADVGDAEMDVTDLVAVRQGRGRPRHGVGGVSLDEAQEVEEGAFGEDVQQQGDAGEVGLLEERVE